MSEFTVNDVLTIDIESEMEASAEQRLLALQRAINSGMWSLQGSYGRAMMAAIEDGQCMLGTHSARDYWGNYIPSRDEVKEGTKGSRAFVVARMGEAWAKRVEEA